MIHIVFSVYDSKLKAFYPPFLAANELVGRRFFATGANDPNSQLFTHPEDFTLFEIARWDDELGQYELVSPHVTHGLAANYRTREQQ